MQTMEALQGLYDKLVQSSIYQKAPQIFKSKYFYAAAIIGYGTLLFLREKIQGPGFFDRKAIVSLQDLTDKTVIITGGNSGIGLGAAILFAQRNANVIIACRNEKKAADAVQFIKQVKSIHEHVSIL